MMRLTLILFAIVVAVIVFAIVDHNEMQRQNCVRTENYREDTSWIPIYDSKGNITSMLPQVSTVYEYKCDDHNRWR